MRILDLSVRNYRAFSELQSFHFGDGFTVIAGVNGIGKTAILDAIAVLVSRLTPQISPNRTGFTAVRQSDVHAGANEFELLATLNCAGYPVNYELRYEKERRRISKTRLPLQVAEEIRKAYGDPSRADDAAPLAVYYSPERAARTPYRLRIPKNLPRGQEAAYSGALYNRRVKFEDFVARYRASVALENDQRQSNPGFLGDPAIAAISHAMDVFLPGFRNLRVQEEPLNLLVEKNGDWLDFNQLSHGERSFLALICDLIRRLALANPRIPNPLTGAGIVLIDEIEVHLHPTWQLEIVEKLRTMFPNVQFIATTHSPFIVQTAREGEIVKLGGDLAVEPGGRTLEEVARLVMDVTNTERSPRYQAMLDTARRYLELVEVAKTAGAERQREIQRDLVAMLAPFSDNVAYTALLERKGFV